MGERLANGNAAITLLANSVATGCALYVLIVAFGGISGAHFNPLVTFAAWFEGAISTRRALAHGGAQVSGAAVGVIVANAMFDLPPWTCSTRIRTGQGQWIAEAVATFGLILVIRLLATRGIQTVAAAVAAYITAAYWFTSSTSFANPAVTLARSLTNTFAGIDPSSVPAFIGAQLAGAIAGYALAAALSGRAHEA
jgi:glycerol uptake facilitator-like aquaporin